jgi:hypothetical protein
MFILFSPAKTENRLVRGSIEGKGSLERDIQLAFLLDWQAPQLVTLSLQSPCWAAAVMGGLFACLQWVRTDSSGFPL